MPHKAIPIFIVAGSPTEFVAINSALVRAVEPATGGGSKIVFDHQHAIHVMCDFDDAIEALFTAAKP